MKRYFIVFTVCMALMLVGLCVMLKFVCLGNLTRAAVAFVLMSVSGILSYLVYRTYDVIKDMKSHYEYFGLDDGTAYMGLQNDTRLDLYFGSLPVRQLREERRKYVFLLNGLDGNRKLFRNQKDELRADYARILRFIQKYLQI